MLFFFVYFLFLSSFAATHSFPLFHSSPTVILPAIDSPSAWSGMESSSSSRPTSLPPFLRTNSHQGETPSSAKCREQSSRSSHQRPKTVANERVHGSPGLFPEFESSSRNTQSAYGRHRNARTRESVSSPYARGMSAGSSHTSKELRNQERIARAMQEREEKRNTRWKRDIVSFSETSPGTQIRTTILERRVNAWEKSSAPNKSTTGWIMFCHVSSLGSCYFLYI